MAQINDVNGTNFSKYVPTPSMPGPATLNRGYREEGLHTD